MNIYLVRHAEALEPREGMADELRHLTGSGRKLAAKQARRLKKLKVRPDLIITSPRVRAVQTAELLAAQVGRDAVVAAHPSLTGEADPEETVRLLREAGKLHAILLVGHEPHLSRVAAQLLGLEHSSPLHKGACLALRWKPEKQDHFAQFSWYAAGGKKLVTTPRKALARQS